MQERVPDECGYGTAEGGVFASLPKETWRFLAQLAVCQRGAAERLGRRIRSGVQSVAAHATRTLAERKTIRRRSPPPAAAVRQTDVRPTALPEQDRRRAPR